MTPAEAEQLLHLTQSLHPALPVRGDTAQAWAWALERITYDHARTAILDWARNNDDPPTIRQICAIARHQANTEDLTRRAHDEPPKPGAARCRRDSCRCTHTGGCEAGWIEAGLGPEQARNGVPQYDRVRPCPTCKPELIASVTGAADRRTAMAAWREEGAGKTKWTGGA